MNYDYGIMSDDGIGTRVAAPVGQGQNIDRTAIVPSGCRHHAYYAVNGESYPAE